MTSLCLQWIKGVLQWSNVSPNVWWPVCVHDETKVCCYEVTSHPMAKHCFLRSTWKDTMMMFSKMDFIMYMVNADHISGATFMQLDTIQACWSRGLCLIWHELHCFSAQVGDTVNVASRMESMGMTNAVQISGATYAQLQQQSAPLLNDQDEEDGHAKLPGSRRWVVHKWYILLPPTGGCCIYCIYSWLPQVGGVYSVYIAASRRWV